MSSVHLRWLCWLAVWAGAVLLVACENSAPDDEPVVIGLVYGFLPFMVLPLYASIERIDLSLVEASRDLYASGFQTFRRVLLPLSMPGVSQRQPVSLTWMVVASPSGWNAKVVR